MRWNSDYCKRIRADRKQWSHAKKPRDRNHDYRKSVELQLRALPRRNLNKIRDLASWLIVAIKENHQLPAPLSAALAREAEVKHAIAERAADTVRQPRRVALQPAYFEFLRGRAEESSQRLTAPC